MFLRPYQAAFLKCSLSLAHRASHQRRAEFTPEEVPPAPQNRSMYSSFISYPVISLIIPRLCFVCQSLLYSPICTQRMCSFAPAPNRQLSVCNRYRHYPALSCTYQYLKSVKWIIHPLNTLSSFGSLPKNHSLKSCTESPSFLARV